MPYNITFPAAGEMQVLLDNGDTQAYVLSNATSIKVGVERNPVPTTAYADPPGDMTLGFQENWFVLIRFSDDSTPYRIWMGEVDNQGTWVNTQAGANQCRTDVQAAVQ